MLTYVSKQGIKGSLTSKVGIFYKPENGKKDFKTHPSISRIHIINNQFPFYIFKWTHWIYVYPNVLRRVP